MCRHRGVSVRIASRSIALVCLAWAAPAGALSLSFTKISYGTTQPGGYEVEYGGIPSIDAGVIAYNGYTSDPDLSGVYTQSGGTQTTVTDSNSQLPGASEFGFPDFWASPTISEGNVAFLVNEEGFPSIFASLDGTLTRIADSTATLAPDGNGLSIDYQIPPMIDGRNVAFRAYNESSGDAVFTWVDGVLETSVDQSTPIEGSSQTIGFSGPYFALDGSSVAFQGGDGDVGTGIYVANADSARVVADGLTPIPGESILFGGFRPEVAFDAGNVAFIGGAVLSTDPLVVTEGLYAEIGGVLIPIADRHTPLPGSAGFLQASPAVRTSRSAAAAWLSWPQARPTPTASTSIATASSTR